MSEIDRWHDEIGWLRGLALQLVGDAHLAEDLAQQTAALALERGKGRSDAASEADELLEQVEIHRDLTEAVLALDPDSREVVVLRYFHDQTPAEIAARIDREEPTVRSRLARAVEELRAQLDVRHGGDRWAWLAPLRAVLGGGAPDARSSAS